MRKFKTFANNSKSAFEANLSLGAISKKELPSWLAGYNDMKGYVLDATTQLAQFTVQRSTVVKASAKRFLARLSLAIRSNPFEAP